MTVSLKKVLGAGVAVVFILDAVCSGQSPVPVALPAVLDLPPAGTMVVPSRHFTPPMFKGMTVNPDNPMRFDFILDSGDSGFSQEQVKNESARLVRYFLAAMTIPQGDLWVNLSPYESDRVVPAALAKTELGRDMLAQDYLLKQLTATLLHPDGKIGRTFWNVFYDQVLGSDAAESCSNAFTKVWIVPEDAAVFENGASVYIMKSRLKVLLDEDYRKVSSDRKRSPVVDVMRSAVIPVIEKEVNEGEQFALIRQIYQSLILAKWYKETVQGNVFAKAYIDQNKIKGISLEDATVKDRIYARYVDAFEKGVFSFTRRDIDASAGVVVEKTYFSGGERFDQLALTRAPVPAVMSAPVGRNYRLSLDMTPLFKDGGIGSLGNAAELKAVEGLIRDLVSREGYDEYIVRLLVEEHWKRLKQREPVDLTQPKWLERMELSVDWWMQHRAVYDYEIGNIFGNGDEEKDKRVGEAAAEFRKIMESEVAKTGNKFFVYSGGSGVGKSTIWDALKSSPGGDKFKKFLMYTTRPRRPDEDPSFNHDIDVAAEWAADPLSARAIEMILNQQFGDPKAVTIDTVADFRSALLKGLNIEEGELPVKIEKILDLSSLGEGGKRIGQSPRQKQIGQDVRISLAERISWINQQGEEVAPSDPAKHRVRVFGEFDGVQYYFADEQDLVAGYEGSVVTKEGLAAGNTGDIVLLPYGSLMQALSLKAIDEVISSQSDNIFVLETTPENVRMIQAGKPEVKSIYISPFKNIVVIGASGFVGRKIYAFLRQHSQSAVIGTSFSSSREGFRSLDLYSPEAIRDFIDEYKPDTIVYAAGVASPQDAEKDKAKADYLNAGVIDVFKKYFKGHFVYLSTDYVFDGTQPPYAPDSTPNPLNYYGKTKLDGERRAADFFDRHSVIRCGLLFGYNDKLDRSTFVKAVVDGIERGRQVKADDVQKRYPVSTDDVAAAVDEVISGQRYGIYHINGNDELTKAGLARKIQRIYAEEVYRDGQEAVEGDLVVPVQRQGGVPVPGESRMINSKVFTITDVDESLRVVVRNVATNLKGGSTNTLKVVDGPDGTRLVRKESPSGSWQRDKEKFKAQVEWLERIPADLKVAFPEIVAHNLESSAQRPYYDMPFYQGRTLTGSILFDGMGAESARQKLDEVLDFWSNRMLKANAVPVPADYLKETLIERTRQSLAQVKHDAPEVFSDIIDAEEVYVNGTRYRNIPVLLDELEKDKELLQKLTPPELRFTHGDFHFDNMFFKDEGGFILLDPRGDEAGDPVYDLAKLAHTIVGKYDLLNYDFHESSVEKTPQGKIRISYAFPEENMAWKVYKDLENGFAQMTDKYYGDTAYAVNDPHWRKRLDLSLAKIMANLPVYHLKHDRIEARAVALYAMGVIYMNQFFDRYAEAREDSIFDGGVNAPIGDASDVGGIDMNDIRVQRMNGQVRTVRLDSRPDNEIAADLEGFTAVITAVTLVDERKFGAEGGS